MTTPSNNETLYKFIVNSADEAVSVLRERLGEHAKVISVRQVEGAGLARFLGAPKLEIIAKRETAFPEFVTGMPNALGSFPESAPIATGAAESQGGAMASVAGSVVATGPEVASSMAGREVPVDPPDDLSRILQRGGISDVVLARLQGREEWASIARRPLRAALTEISVLLRGDYQRKVRRPTGSRVAFVGTPGAGKTTALCKRLAMEVFFKQRHASVLKMDMEKANPADGLAVFCDVLGVAMVRSPDDIVALEPNETLYIDFPGVTADNQGELDELSKMLASVRADTRVLVINAAYEAGLIRAAYRMGTSLAATHVVFTHLDELTRWGKLWEFILSSELTPLFLGSGQNIAGDFDESVFEAVLERSFAVGGAE